MSNLIYTRTPKGMLFGWFYVPKNPPIEHTVLGGPGIDSVYHASSRKLDTTPARASDLSGCLGTLAGVAMV